MFSTSEPYNSGINIMELEETKSKIIELYRQEFLVPELGSGGRLEQKLSDGLKQVLNRLNIPDNLTIDDPSLSLLDKPINIKAIRDVAEEIGGVVLATKARNAFHSNEIETYRDLVKNINGNYEERMQDEGRICTADGKSEGVRKGLSDGTNVGTKTYVVIYKHLHSLGIEVFPDGYRPSELGEKEDKSVLKKSKGRK